MTLEEAFAYYTECQLATAEGLEMKKSSPKGEVTRQRGIADEMVAVCRSAGLKPVMRSGKQTPRLARLLTVS